MKIKAILCLFIAIFMVIWLWKKLKNYVRSVILALKIPGPKPNSILGNVALVKDGEAISNLARNAQQLYGSIFRGWLLNIPIFYIYEPEYLKIILSNSKIRSDKNFLYSLGETFLGEGLLTNNGHKWKNNRKLMQPYFQLNYLRNYLDSFVESSKSISKYLTEDEYVNITKFINMAVLSGLYREVLGMTLDDEEDSPFRCNELLIVKRLMKPWLISEYVYKKSRMSKNESVQKMSIRDFTKEAMKRRMETRQSDKTTCCLMDMLLEIHEKYPNDFTEENVINELVTFMLAGQDSTATSIAFCIFYISKHPKIQDQIYKELNEIFVDDNIKTVDIDQLNKMVYLEQCIKESMRITPVVPFYFRVLRDDVDLGTYTIPAGSNICIAPVITHILPNYFPDPLKYDPERFSAENVKKIHPFSYIPFSSGARNCIGPLFLRLREMKTQVFCKKLCIEKYGKYQKGAKFAMLKVKATIAAILRKYQLILKPGTEDLHLKYNIVFKAKGGVWVRAKLRNSN